MDFSFAADDERKVFRIGYSVTEGRPDNSYSTFSFGIAPDELHRHRQRRDVPQGIGFAWVAS